MKLINSESTIDDIIAGVAWAHTKEVVFKKDRFAYVKIINGSERHCFFHFYNEQRRCWRSLKCSENIGERTSTTKILAECPERLTDILEFLETLATA